MWWVAVTRPATCHCWDLLGGTGSVGSTVRPYIAAAAISCTRRMLVRALLLLAPGVSGIVPLQEKKKPDVQLGSTTPWMQTSGAPGAITQSKADDLGASDGGPESCYDPGQGLCKASEYTYQQAWQAVDQRIAKNPRKLPRKRFVPCAEKLGYTETSCVDADALDKLCYCMGVD